MAVVELVVPLPFDDDNLGSLLVDGRLLPLPLEVVPTLPSKLLLLLLSLLSVLVACGRDLEWSRRFFFFLI